MAPYRLSYVKTLVTAAILGLSVFLITHVVASSTSGFAKPLIVVVGWSATLVLLLVLMGAAVVLYRDQMRAGRRIDLFDAANESRAENALATTHPDLGILLRRLGRRVMRRQTLLVGDTVTIRSLQEIRRTLDGSGCLDGLPFMAEMAGFCGQRARVFRRVDKIYDYGRTKSLRRLKGAVLLTGLRCDGSAHDGCQASCYLLWKEAWLSLAAEDRSARDYRGSRASMPSGVTAASRGRYTCQYTQLANSSSPMTKWDIRQDFRPLIAGNVTLRAFCVAILTRLFNAVQTLRKGAGYPGWEIGSTRHNARSTEQRLASGDTVRVLPISDIALTLNSRGRNRGLWFDRDMVRHCGRRYTILRRVERIIDDATGEMLELKTPSVVLDGAEASGEFLRFCAQHEYPLWREAWLSRE